MFSRFIHDVFGRVSPFFQGWIILHSRMDNIFFIHSSVDRNLWIGCFCILAIVNNDTVIHRLGEGNGTPLQYSCLENPMDGGAWWAAVQGVARSRTWLSDFPFTFPFHALEKEMATHSSVLAWRIPGTGEPGGLPSLGSHRVGHDWSDLPTYLPIHRLHISLWDPDFNFFNISEVGLLDHKIVLSLKISINLKMIQIMQCSLTTIDLN